MSFQDDAVEAEPHRHALAYVCQRCNAVCTVPVDDPPEVALRRCVETMQLHTFHRCAHDGGMGLARLVGEATAYANAAEALKAGKAAA